MRACAAGCRGGVWPKGERFGRQVHQLNHICIDATLCGFLERTQTLTPHFVQALDWTCRIRLQAVLYSLGSPGGPMYPPRSVRQAARRVMDALFPRGRVARRAVNLCFRLLNPYRWPASLIHWLTRQLPGAAWAAVLHALPVPVSARAASAAARARWLLGQATRALPRPLRQALLWLGGDTSVAS